MAEQAVLSFNRTYTLLAQTPIIHFQHNQSGAALRPSEVKPKLDRYLRKRYDGEMPAAWEIPGQPHALNYQMRITALEENKPGTPDIGSCKSYFGNLGEAEEKGLVFRDCRIEINCFIPDLLKFLDANIGSFFVFHNFGTRQSKGFGGFLVKEKTTEAQAAAIIEQHCPHYFFAEFPDRPDAAGRLNHAMVVYSCMKNGFSMGNRRFDGYATCGYMYGDVGNDQEYIRDCVIRKKPARYDTYEFIRAVLGLAESYDYRQKGVVKVLHYRGTRVENGRPCVPLESIQNDQGIKRFQSPVLIKIFRNKMFFLLMDDCREILGEVFLLIEERDWKPIQAMIQNKQFAAAQQALRQNAKCIATPESFDGEFFMRDFVDYFNEEKNVIRSFPRIWKPSADLILEKGGRK